MKEMTNRIIWGISKIIYDFIRLFSSNKLFINGSFSRKGFSFENNNWGDDVNIWFLQDISKLKILVKNRSNLYRFLPINSFSCIGSIIESCSDKHTSVWGSGLIKRDMPIPHKPQKLYSVRGPLTRRELMNRGIDCPEIYGDPALLVSRYYRPRVTKKYDLGIIPHYVDEKNPNLEEFCKLHPEVLIIPMRGYKHWHDIPDQILSCRRIISSSLHGLIISDSYSVPNAWVRFSNQITGGNFKYLDYFASVGRTETNPHIISDYRDLEEIFNHDKFGLATNINYDEIFNACPFKDKLKKYWELTPKLPQYVSVQEKCNHFAEHSFVDTKEQLDKLLITLESLEEGFLFRGMNDARFKMYSSSQRHWMQNTDRVYRVGESKYYTFIQSLINKSKELKVVEDYVSKQSVHPNDMFCLALLQHFGAPSPMLDFSHSLYKSLFFTIDGLNWDGKETGGLEDYVSVYYIPKCVDWVYTTCQKVMETAAQDADRRIAEHKQKYPYEPLNCDDIKQEFLDLPFLKFKPDGSEYSIVFLPLGGPADGRIQISIPTIGFSCNYLIINDRLLSQEGMFIMNNTLDKPLVELMNEKTRDKYFRCVNIHKKLATYIRDKYLKPRDINHATVYCDGDVEVSDIQQAIVKI